MSAFRPGVNVGTRVNQGQIIGYVGSTGISTGAHLHYEIIKDNVQTNPLTVKLPPEHSLTTADMPKFHAGRDRLDMQFQILDKDFSQFSTLIDINEINPDKIKK
jgi:hypothetical protein